MSRKYNKHEKAKIFGLIVAIALIGAVAYGQATYIVPGINGTAYKAPVSQDIAVNAPDGSCWDVKNSGASNGLFVPTNTQAEWNAFIAHAGPNAGLTQMSIPTPVKSTQGFSDGGCTGSCGHTMSWQAPVAGAANVCYNNAAFDTQYMSSGTCSIGSGPSWSPLPSLGTSGSWVDLGAVQGYGGSNYCQCTYSVRARSGPINGQYSAWGPTVSWTTGTVNSSANGCNQGAAS